MIVLLIAARLYRQRNRKPPSNGLLIFTALMCLILLGVKAERESGVETIAEDADRKLVAITFDDGPNNDYTRMLLSGLKERGVKATFFLLGKEVVKYPEIVAEIHADGHLIGTHSYEHVNLKNLCDEAAIEQVDKTLGKEVVKYPEIVAEIHADGHLIGTHSYEHVNLKNLCDEAAIEQVDKTNEAIHAITGEYPEYIRPPFGSWKCNLDYETKMIEVLWDIDPLDWKTNNSESMQSPVNIPSISDRRLEAGNVILIMRQR